MARDTVEVVAMLGDTMLDVQRVDRAARGRVAWITWGIFAAGALAIAATGVLFAIALGGASTEAQQFDDWVVLRRPAYAYRAHSPFGSSHALHGVDILAIAALVAGIALVTIAIARAVRERRCPGVRVGDVTIGSDTPVPTRLQTGLVTLVVSRVADERVALPHASFERRVLPYFGASLAVHIATWLILAQHSEARYLAVEGDDDRLGVTLSEDSDLPAADDIEVTEDRELGGGSGDEAPQEAMALPEGARSAAASQESAQASAASAAWARQQIIEQARVSGIFANDHLASDVRTLVAAADLSGGFSTGGVYSGGESYDGFGAGVRGFGPGGGGFGTVASGRYVTVLAGNGTGAGYGFAGGRGGMTGRTTAVPTVTICGRHIDGSSCVLAVGDMDKAIIRRYIRRSLPKFQYCYERQLLAKPGLRGTVTAQFMIATDGTVSTSKAQGMDDAVSACVADVVQNIEFPRPTRGGTTQVTYPFTFQTAE